MTKAVTTHRDSIEDGNGWGLGVG